MTAHSEKNMLTKLHLKFTFIIFGVSALILVVSFGYIAWSNNAQTVNSVYSELSDALETVTAKGPHEKDITPNDLPEIKGESAFTFNFDYSGTEPPRIGDKRETSWAFPIGVYVVNENDAAPSVNILADYSTAIVDETTLEDALAQTLTSEDDHGFLANLGLYYQKISIRQGISYFAFADKSVVENGAHLSSSLFAVGIIILLLIFALAWAFSKWALRPVQRAWDAQQQFIADASHEMKTPLTVIMANASIALKKPQASIAEQSQWIEGIQDEAQNMEHLVLDMLALAQPENAATSDANCEDVNLSEMAEKATLQFEALAFERGVELEQSITPNVVVHGNPAKLQRLLGTLIDNACKYADKQTCITVSLTQDARHCTLSVHNWGTPIDEKDLPHLFDRFYRSDKSRDRSNEDGEHSFGLGLAIAQKIAHTHGGSLQVSSTAEAGTTFCATLPRTC